MLLHQGLGAGEDWKNSLFDRASLESVFELNALFLSTLARIATEPAISTAGDAIGKLALSLSRQTVTARETLAQCPIALVEMGFRDGERWARAIEEPERMIISPGGIFPYLDAIRLANQTLMLAWTTAQTAWRGACIVFGMTREVADRLAHSSLQTIQRVAERYPHWVRPIWEHQPEMWDYLVSMSNSPPKKLPPVGLRALQRRLADLEPATCEKNETRSSRDLE
jgi:hypothetical protein